MKTPAMEQVSRWLAAKPKFLSMYGVKFRGREVRELVGGGGNGRWERRNYLASCCLL
jgi:hypothetical protein